MSGRWKGLVVCFAATVACTGQVHGLPLGSIFKAMERAAANSSGHAAEEAAERAATNSGRHAAEEAAAAAAVSADRLSDDVLRGATTLERNEFQAALDAFRTSAPGEMKQLESAVVTGAGDDGKKAIGRTIPFSDDLPHVRLRTAASPLHDSLVQDFAQARLNSIMKEPFDVSDIHIVALAMADSATVSASEIRRFAQRLPAESLDLAGPLSRMPPDVSKEQMLAALEPYRGSTVIVTGHVPDGELGFFRFGSDGRKQDVALSAWTEAAREAGVNIIPLGCNTGRFAEFGARGLINSADVLARLQDVMRRRPTDIGSFFQYLTGNDLEIVIDPLKVTLFSNGAQIVNRQSQKVVGHIGLKGVLGKQTGLEIVRTTWRTERPVPTTHGTYARCFEQITGDGFDHCVDGRRAQLAAEDLARQREERMNQLPAEIAEARSQHSSRFEESLTRGVAYLFIWLIGGLLIPTEVLLYQAAQEDGESGRNVLTGARAWRYAIRGTWEGLLGFLPQVARSLRRCWTEKSGRGLSDLFTLFIFLPLVMGLLVPFVPAVNELLWVLIAATALWALFCLGVVSIAWESGSFGMMRVPIASAVMVLAACIFMESIEVVCDAATHVEELESELTKLGTSS